MTLISQAQITNCITYTFYEKAQPISLFEITPSEWKVARISKGLDQPIPDFQWGAYHIPLQNTQAIVRHLKQRALNMRLVCKFFSHSSFNEIYRETPLSKMGNSFLKNTRGFLFFIGQFPRVSVTNPKIHGEQIRPFAIPAIREKFPRLTSLKSIVVTGPDEIRDLLDQHHDFLPVIRSLIIHSPFSFPGIPIDLIHEAIKSLYNLAHLEMTCSALQGLFSEFEFNSLPKLKSVKLKDSDVTTDTLIRLFEAAPHLKYIIIPKDKNINIDELQTYISTNNVFPSTPHIILSDKFDMTNAERAKLPKNNLTIIVT